jgi:hypothetical protein
VIEEAAAYLKGERGRNKIHLARQAPSDTLPLTRPLFLIVHSAMNSPVD